MTNDCATGTLLLFDYKRVIRVKALSHLGFPITFELTTESGAQSNDFAIDQRTGVVDLLHTLDYETDPVEYHLKIKAVENRRVPATSTVNVNSFCLLYYCRVAPPFNCKLAAKVEH